MHFQLDSRPKTVHHMLDLSKEDAGNSDRMPVFIHALQSDAFVEFTWVSMYE